MEKCSECRGKVVKKRVNYAFLGENLGKFEAEVCTECGETLFSEAASKKIREAAKSRDLWNLSSKARISRIGGSIAVTINKRLAEFVNLKKGEEVRIYPEDKRRIVIETI